jgi:hypothetical protein
LFEQQEEDEEVRRGEAIKGDKEREVLQNYFMVHLTSEATQRVFQFFVLRFLAERPALSFFLFSARPGQGGTMTLCMSPRARLVSLLLSEIKRKTFSDSSS